MDTTAVAGATSARSLARERWRLLANTVKLLEPAMAALGFIWLALLVLDFTQGLTRSESRVSTAIWIVFILNFVAELAIAPRKGLYLRRHWLVAVSLLVPALRVLRVARMASLARAARAFRGVRLVRTLASLNRAVASLRVTMRRRGFAYVVATTVLVTIAGSAGMFAFEHHVPDPAGLHDVPSALWWTAMLMTTMGSAYWPVTSGGRVLCVLLAVYAFVVWGYLTATLATFFVSQDAGDDRSSLAGQKSVNALRDQVERLRPGAG